MNIFAKECYRTILREKIAAVKSIDRSVTNTSLAEKMRIQPPYLSKVLNGTADFNTDQLFLLCESLEMDREEEEYLALLLERERSISEKRKEVLTEKIDAIQLEKSDLIKRSAQKGSLVSTEQLGESGLTEFYMDPMCSVVHVFLSIPKYRKEPFLIVEKLNIREERFSEILRKLERLKIIEVKDDKIKLKIKDMFLPKESYLTTPYMKLMDSLCHAHKVDIPFEEKKHFILTFASDEKVKKQIIEEFNLFFERVKKIHSKGTARECYQMNFDLFQWS